MSSILKLKRTICLAYMWFRRVFEGRHGQFKHYPFRQIKEILCPGLWRHHKSVRVKTNTRNICFSSLFFLFRIHSMVCLPRYIWRSNRKSPFFFWWMRSDWQRMSHLIIRWDIRCHSTINNYWSRTKLYVIFLHCFKSTLKECGINVSFPLSTCLFSTKPHGKNMTMIFGYFQLEDVQLKREWIAKHSMFLNFTG